MKNKFLNGLTAFTLIMGLLPFAASCGPGNSSLPADTPSYQDFTPLPEIDITPEPTASIPDFTPSQAELPESYDFYDLAMSGLKSRSARFYKERREDVFVKLGKRYGFCGNVSFEYCPESAAYVPVEVLGFVYVPFSGFVTAFGADCVEDEKTISVTYGNSTAVISTLEDSVTVGSDTLPFRKPVKIGNLYYVDLECAALLFDYKTERSEDLIQMTAKEKKEKADPAEAAALFDKYDSEIYEDLKVKCSTTGSGLYPPVDPAERQVGIAYTTWFRADWKWGEGHTWDIPWLGSYTSNDRNVIRQHGIWLRDAGIDFVFVDWSNNINYVPETMRNSRPDFRMIEEATEVLFDVWADIPGAPKICIFTGPGHQQGSGNDDTIATGRMKAKTDQIYNTFLANERYRSMYYEYEGKPLLICYAATPAFFQDNVSPYEDDRFTVRWITGYVGQQGDLFDTDTLVSKMFWSWEERGAQTFTVLNGHPECMTVNASYRSQGSTPGTSGYIAPGLRNNGNTFRKAWARARLIGPKLVLVVSFNEWTLGEQISLENAKDIEPSQTTGSFYLDLMREQIRAFKGRK